MLNKTTGLHWEKPKLSNSPGQITQSLLQINCQRERGGMTFYKSKET